MVVLKAVKVLAREGRCCREGGVLVNRERIGREGEDM